MIAWLLAGFALGLPAGFSPGPMLTLVIAQTVRHGAREGLKVATAPLFSDTPIILISLWILTRLGNTQPALGAISLAGAGFLVFLAIESFRTRGFGESSGDDRARSLGKGIVANLLNPHPYIFWFSVGSPLLLKAWSSGVGEGVAFLAGFYVCLVGSKLLLAALVGRGRAWLTGGVYVWMMRGLGVVLLIFAAIFAREGIGLLGAWNG